MTATLAAGLTVGGWGRIKISVPIRHHLQQFWAYIAFISNALISLMVGLRVNLSALWANAGSLIWVVAAMLVSRGVVIYGLMPLLGRIPRSERIGAAYKAVMFWGWVTWRSRVGNCFESSTVSRTRDFRGARNGSCALHPARERFNNGASG